MNDETQDTLRVPVMPVTHTVLLPGAVVPLVLFEENDLALVDEVCRSQELALGVVYSPRREMDTGLSTGDIGTLGRIIQHKRSPKGEVSLMVQGTRRMRVASLLQQEPFAVAEVSMLEDDEPEDPRRLRERVLEVFQDFLDHCQGDVAGLKANLDAIQPLGGVVDVALACVPLDTDARQKLLETLDTGRRAEGFIALLEHHLRKIGLKRNKRFDPGHGFSLN